MLDRSESWVRTLLLSAPAAGDTSESGDSYGGQRTSYQRGRHKTAGGPAGAETTTKKRTTRDTRQAAAACLFCKMRRTDSPMAGEAAVAVIE